MTLTPRRFILLAVCLALSCPAMAQRAMLSGAVSDQRGSPLNDARITLLNLDQGLKRDTTTNASGYYTIPLLQPGNYLVTVQKPGFMIAEFRDILLHVGEDRGLNIQLRVGATPIEIQVSGKAQSVDTVSPTLGAVVTADVVRNAPLNGRDIRDLAPLQAGVVPTDSDYTNNGVGTYNVAGNRADSVAYLLDGGFNNDLLANNAVFTPNPDTVAEFRILISNYPAEYGRNSGGVVSVATRSGSNEFHGGLFEFLRNDDFDANSYFNKQNGLPRSDLKRNQFGGTLGGPLTIPKIVSGKDRLFFFVGYQGETQVQDLGEPNIPTYTPAELQGNFSQANNGQADPNVAAFLQANPYFLPSGGNPTNAIIDPAKINSVAQNYIKTGLIPTSASGQISSQQPLNLNEDELTTKFDFDVNPKNKLALTLGWDRAHEVTPYDFATVPGFPDVSDFHDYVFNLAHTYLFSPSLLNEAKFTIERSTTNASRPERKLPTPQQLGIGITPDLPTGPTDIAFDDNLSLGFSDEGPQRFDDTTYTFSDAFTWSRGKHSWKTGGGISIYQSNAFFALQDDGRFVFLSNTQGGSGNPLADFLLGLPAFYEQNAAAPSNLRSKFSFGFLQDDWRVLKTLTLSLGVRYEYSTPKLDTQGRTFSVIPGLQSTVFPNAPPGMVFPGDRGAPRGVNFPDKNDWAPRVGFAWDIDGKGKMSLRGAFGTFYDILKGEDNLQFVGRAPFFASSVIQFPPLADPATTNYLADPFGSTGTINPFPSTTPPSNLNFAAYGYLPIGGGFAFTVDPHLRTPYSYQYHLTFQRELWQNTIFQSSYVGTSSHGLTALIDIDPFVLGTPNRVLDITPPGSSCGVNEAYPCYGIVNEFKNVANASYNSLLTSLQKQFSSAKFFGQSYLTFSYTYSHNIDDASGFNNRNSSVPSYDPGLFRASADMDVRHSIAFSGGWELPFNQILENAPERLTRGWSVFPILTWRTGFPLDVFASVPAAFGYAEPGPSGAGDASLVHANLTGPIQFLNPSKIQSVSGQTGNYWFNPGSFTNAQCPDVVPTTCQPSSTVFPSDYQVESNPALRTYGTLPRNYFRGPGETNLNLAFSKVTPINERLKLEVRADFFNILNHTEYKNPDVSITDQTFGRILTTFDPRIIQLAMRLSF